jgi:hypothetical protein
VLRWIELGGWSKKYDVEQIAREVKTDDWALTGSRGAARLVEHRGV